MAIIWLDDMESSLNWERTGDVSFNLNSTACLDLTSRCVKTDTVDGDSFIERTTIITGYLDIVLQVDLRVNSIDSLNGEYCSIAYKYDQNEYIVYNQYNQDGLYENELVHFPPSYSSSTITVKLGVHGVAGDIIDRCYWDNAILKGNAVPTSQPTNDPTALPTADPTKSMYFGIFSWLVYD